MGKEKQNDDYFRILTRIRDLRDEFLNSLGIEPNKVTMDIASYNIIRTGAIACGISFDISPKTPEKVFGMKVFVTQETNEFLAVSYDSENEKEEKLLNEIENMTLEQALEIQDKNMVSDLIQHNDLDTITLYEASIQKIVHELSKSNDKLYNLTQKIQNKIDILGMEEYYDYADNKKVIRILKEILAEVKYDDNNN